MLTAHRSTIDGFQPVQRTASTRPSPEHYLERRSCRCMTTRSTVKSPSTSCSVKAVLYGPYDDPPASSQVTYWQVHGSVAGCGGSCSHVEFESLCSSLFEHGATCTTEARTSMASITSMSKRRRRAALGAPEPAYPRRARIQRLA